MTEQIDLHLNKGLALRDIWLHIVVGLFCVQHVVSVCVIAHGKASAFQITLGASVLGVFPEESVTLANCMYSSQ